MLKDNITQLLECKWTITKLPLDEQVVVQRTQHMFGFQINGLRVATAMWDAVIIGRNFGLVALYVIMHAAGYPQESIIIGLMCFLVPFLCL